MKKTRNITKAVAKTVEKMPFFAIENLSIINDNKKYLRLLLSRMKIKKSIIRVKRGMYVSANYLNDLRIKGLKDDYLEFIACKAYEPAYLSAEYILSKNGILSESVFGFSLISTNKTYRIVNDFGVFSYYHIRSELFIGYKTIKKSDFLIYKASVSKALFDFLYLRKNILVNFKAFQALRLNIENLKKKDIKELKKYINIEGSSKMMDIYNWLLKTYEQN